MGTMREELDRAEAMRVLLEQGLDDGWTVEVNRYSASFEVSAKRGNARVEVELHDGWYDVTGGAQAVGADGAVVSVAIPTPNLAHGSRFARSAQEAMQQVEHVARLAVAADDVARTAAAAMDGAA